jgi:GNAT superfamily N-acetyltransferase
VEKPEIRLATADDAAEIARLRWKFSLEERDPTESRERFGARLAEHVRRYLASERWSIWVAAESGEPRRLLATLFLQRVEKVPRPYPRPAAWGYITNVYVDASWRNRGLGRALLDVAVAAARTEGLDTLLLWPNSRAIPLYERVGFEPATGAMELPLDES